MKKREVRPLILLCLLPLLILLIFPARQMLQAKRTRDLGYAVRWGYKNRVPRLIAAGADVNGRLPDGKPFIEYAATQNNREVVSLLYSAGARATPLVWQQMNEWIRMDLSVAVYTDDAATIARLLRAGVAADFPANKDPGNTFLMLAASRGNLAAARQLLQAGANPNARDKRGNSVLWYALSQGDKCGPAVKLLTGAGARPAANDRLLMAIQADNVGQARAALQAGANPNVRIVDGSPVLAVAAIDSALVRLLLGAGANPNARLFGESTLTIARRNGNGVHTNRKADPQALLLIERAANQQRKAARR